MVHGIEAEYWGRIDFVYIDREDVANQSVTQRFGVRSQPVFVLLDAEGNEVTRLFGMVSEADLRAALERVLG
ncbi:MAG: thioredoxin family protein [Anaerolineae bacterium]|nr:thioredoxin family protein [Anaerolineae bacterium]